MWLNRPQVPRLLLTVVTLMALLMVLPLALVVGVIQWLLLLQRPLMQRVKEIMCQ